MKTWKPHHSSEHSMFRGPHSKPSCNNCKQQTYKYK